MSPWHGYISVWSRQVTNYIISIRDFDGTPACCIPKIKLNWKANNFKLSINFLLYLV